MSKRIIRSWEDVRPGDLVYSEYFGREVHVIRVRSDKRWTFSIYEGGEELKAKTKLSWFIQRGLVRRGG